MAIVVCLGTDFFVEIRRGNQNYQSGHWESQSFTNTYGFGEKKGHFPIFFVLANIDQENVFYHNLQRKNVFIGYKNNKFKKSKN